MILTANSPKKIVIIGFGMTGKATSSLFYNFISMDVDFDRSTLPDVLGGADYAIICLPTPTIKGKQDISSIEEWLRIIKKTNPKLPVIIRSTILPGTTDKLSEKYDLQIAFVPEFLTEATAIEDALNPEFLIVGAKDIILREKVCNLFLGTMQTNKIIKCSPVTAELIKYSINSFFALKVIMSNQLWDVAKEVGADYSKVKEALESHKWGSKNGWDVWHGSYRGFSGKCLPKDTEVFSEKYKIPLLKEMVRINNNLIKETK